MKNLKDFITESKNISDRMFIKALKDIGGEVTHDDLVKAYPDYDKNPLMIDDEKPIDSIHIGRGVGICLCYKKDGKDLEIPDQSIESFEYEDIKPLYDYILNQSKIYR